MAIKDHDIKKYKNIVQSNHSFFKQFYYHSIIDSNLIKFDSILENGILTKKMIEYSGLPTLYTHSADDYDSKNGNDFISLTQYTNKTSLSLMFESFAWHTLSSLSLMIDKNIKTTSIGDKETYFDDEIFSSLTISTDNIKGILLPDILSNKSFDRICPLANDLTCYTRGYINNWIYQVEEYFNQTIDKEKILGSVNELWDILNKDGSPEKWFNYALERQKYNTGSNVNEVLANIIKELWENKLKLENPKFIDVVKIINDDRYPIYEIKEKELVKILK